MRDPAACTLVAGDLTALFLPTYGMLGASLKHRGVELLRRVDDLDAHAASGSSAGIPILYPWANRLDASRYRALNVDVPLDRSSPLLHLDDNGLPLHGVPWSQLRWDVVRSSTDSLTARLDWSSRPLLTVFPFRHHVEMTTTLQPDSLAIKTVVIAGVESAVPVSFGFHPYFGFDEQPRGSWRLQLPAMRQLALDARGIPTGKESQQPAIDCALGEQSFDDGFALDDEQATFAISRAGLRIAVELLGGYRHAQVFAPKGKNFVALEPMTAPTNALATGRTLPIVQPDTRFEAAFRIRVEA